ncbi:MAG: hypothetical protein BA872_03515 [Desulfobacterales bacterium C00003060]|nr:MAG: hypothetical protein BA861_09405 [Desulfobacterales bacterium S3730MH5]OEU78857.1 MAG: hypothetical protein BA865_07040 [Desulfobacterales bacterium S5133MH4]OEU79359.1 MAG: hypothetical protein BA872_03515 [Desulfobacterales bacterium C00003060]
MGKKILLAVDDSVYSEDAVKYAARITSDAKDVRYTLFSIQSPVPHILFIEGAEGGSEVNAEVGKLVRRNAEAVGRTVQRFKDLMVLEGIPENRIETVAEPVRLGLAKDILSRAEQGSFDAILLARSGLTPSRDFFIGTIAAKVVEHALRIPVWVADGKSTSVKIMVAVDASENGLRVVDYLTHMVGANPEIRLTLFHVLPHLRHYYSIDFETENPHLQEVLHREDKRRMEDFHEKAHQIFEARGLTKSQIEIKTNTRSYDVSTAILDEARNGDYGTVVVGRRGERGAFFIGRVPMRLVQKVSNQALWVVP